MRARGRTRRGVHGTAFLHGPLISRKLDCASKRDQPGKGVQHPNWIRSPQNKFQVEEIRQTKALTAYVALSVAACTITWLEFRVKPSSGSPLRYLTSCRSCLVYDPSSSLCGALAKAGLVDQGLKRSQSSLSLQEGSLEKFCTHGSLLQVRIHRLLRSVSIFSLS